MPTLLKRNAVIVLGLAALFSWSFMFAKHDPALRNVIPFGDDPYDAVGSFGVIVVMLIALLSLVRAFRPYREYPSAIQLLHLARAQHAVVLIVFIVLASDGVAMVRHPATWSEAAARSQLVALLGGMAIIATAVLLILRTSHGKLRAGATKRWKAAAASTLLALLILLIYPERLIDQTVTHLFTVIVGAAVLFAPMRYLLYALVPYVSDEPTTRPVRRKFSVASKRWGIVFLIGILIGTFAFVTEIADSTGKAPLSHLALVASVYIALGLSGILIAYTFLSEPLGLGNLYSLNGDRSPIDPLEKQNT
jgi:hypothetical protein